MLRTTAPSRSLAVAVGVVALAAVLFCARLGGRALWSMELRWAEIPREMQLRHDYFWPTINGRSYYDKPLGSYWLVLVSAWLTGSLDETAARLPCALSGLVSVVLLMLLARRLYDGRTAILSGLVLATSFGFVFFARTASSDMENVTGELAALYLFLCYDKRRVAGAEALRSPGRAHAGASQTQARPHGVWLIGLWLVMALTSLTKGLLGFALPLLVLGTYSCLSDGRAELVRGLGHGSLSDRLRWLIGRCRWLFNRWSAIGFLLAVTVYLSPFAVSWARTGSTQGLYMVYRENLQRFFNAHNHRGPVYLYAYVIFGLMAPWSALLPAALVRVHATRDADARRGDRFVRAYFWATFVFFTLSSSRRSYYLMPLLPAGALLVGRLLASPQDLSLAGRRLLRLGFGVIALIVVLAGVALLPPGFLLPAPWDLLPPTPERPVFVLCWLAAIGGIVAAVRRFDRTRVALAVGASAFLLLAYFFLVALPSAEVYRGEKALADEARRRLGPDAAGLALYRTREPVFYVALPKPIPEYDDRDSLADAVRDGRVSWVLARRRDLGAAAITATVVSAEPAFAWETAEQVGNKLVLVCCRDGSVVRQ
jgi:4-amino-4-deoxy-L-arabinose transferase-like glycosyltransferase